MTRTVLLRRSLVKALSYRFLIMILDFATLYLLTGKVHIALGFMVASNLYTTIAYIVHERIWSNVTWGIANKVTGAERDYRRPTTSD